MRSRASKRSAIPYVTLGGAQLAVGAAAIFARWALTGALPLAICAARLCIAAVVLLLLAAVRRDMMRTTPRQRALLAGGGFFLALHFACWVWSLEYTSVAVSTLLVATTPIWTALYDSLVRGKHLSVLAWAAFGLGAAGLVLIVGFNRTPAPVPGHVLAGAILALAGAFGIGAYWIAIREVRDALSTGTIVTHTYSWAAAVLLAAALVGRQPPPALHDGVAWGGILGLAVLSQLLGHTAMNSALRWFSPSALAFTTVLEPVVAGLLALAIFHEALAPIAFLGGIIVLVAIALVLREESRTSALSAPAFEAQ